MPDYEVVVVGGGVAGSVLAARLTQQGRATALVEAGADHGAPDRQPRALRSLRTSLDGFPPGSLWSYAGHLTPHSRRTVVRGRTLGGSSAVNGGQYTRPTALDLERWCRVTGGDWSLSAMMPALIRAETDEDFGDRPLHGHDGPLRVRRDAAALTPLAAAFLAGAVDCGHAYVEDLNGSSPTGVGVLPTTSRDGVRHQVASAYLTPEVREGGLAIHDDSTAQRVLLSHGRAVGVEIETGAGREVLYGDQIVLCCGALNTPALLWASGIGDPGTLSAAGAAAGGVCEVPLPGVGVGLMDHPGVWIAVECDRRSEPALQDLPSAQVSLTLSSASGFDGHGDDVRIFPATFPVATTPSTHTYLIFCGLSLTEGRGTLRPDRGVPGGVEVRFDHLRSAADRLRLREAVRHVLTLVRSRPMRALGARVVTPSPRECSGDSVLDTWISHNLSSLYHTTGTCRMGLSEEASVVDRDGRVHGVDGLKIVDLSVAPIQFSRGPFAATVGIAEHAAAMPTWGG